MNAKLVGWFVGQAMKATGGKANPAAVNALVVQKLGPVTPSVAGGRKSAHQMLRMWQACAGFSGKPFVCLPLGGDSH